MVQRLRIEYKCLDVTGGEICDGEEDSEWPSYEPRYETNVVTNVYASGEGPSLYWDEPEEQDESFEPGDAVYLVVATYSTGDTFSQTYGKLAFPGAFRDLSRAEKTAAQIRSDTYRGYRPWDGYFETLECVEVQEFTVKAGANRA